ncbi:MAG: glutamine synthetase type III, partial [Planctomycetota bacterium]
HLNYSMGSAAAGNLFDPGDTPADNAQFLVFCAAMIKSVYTHSKLLRAVIASASNDHRLGANEAPPAILSIFLGDELTQVIEAIVGGGSVKSKKGTLNVGVDVLPPIPKHSGDRNRTSPMAFTGNRFEFRAVGSNSSIAGPLVAMNTIMTEALDEAATLLEKADTSTEKKLGAAVEKYIKQVWKECHNVVFNGDGYSEDWHQEAEKRGLPNLRTTADALPQIKAKDTVALFKKYKILSKRELDSRYEVYAEQYIASVNVESNLVVEIAKTQIFPAAIRYQGELATSLANLKAIGIDTDHDTINQITGLISSLQTSVSELETLKDKEESVNSIEKHCLFIKDEILPKMLEVRGYVDALEEVVADDLWPLPTYQEILFIK